MESSLPSSVGVSHSIIQQSSTTCNLADLYHSIAGKSSSGRDLFVDAFLPYDQCSTIVPTYSVPYLGRSRAVVARAAMQEAVDHVI